MREARKPKTEHTDNTGDVPALSHRMGVCLKKIIGGRHTRNGIAPAFPTTDMYFKLPGRGRARAHTRTCLCEGAEPTDVRRSLRCIRYDHIALTVEFIFTGQPEHKGHIRSTPTHTTTETQTVTPTLHKQRRKPLEHEFLLIAVLFPRSSPEAVPMAAAQVLPNGSPRNPRLRHPPHASRHLSSQAPAESTDNTCCRKYPCALRFPAGRVPPREV